MSNKEFWEEDPELLWAYRKSYIEKIKFQNEINNYNSWLNGLYVNNAISVNLYNTFCREKGQPPQYYIEEPIDFNKQPKTKEEIERENRLKVEEQIRERNKQIQAMLKSR